MKLLSFLLFSFVILSSTFRICNAQAGEWTWMGGDSVSNSLGNLGIQGVPSPTNEPASRYACGYWTDTAGNFWIYSGVNAPGDLWKLDATTLIWTWMAGDSIDPNTYIDSPLGVYNSRNAPGQLGYGMFTWTTPNNHLWLFGGLLNTASGNIQQLELNDNLWQYDPVINEWAWMGTFGLGANGSPNWGILGVGDSSTMPGGREEGNCAWVDSSGNLWLFGGWDINFNSYNDVWKYNVNTGIWTWMSGSKNFNDPGQYDFQGEPLNGNRAYPSARSTNLFWKDANGNFWLSGGTQAGGTSFANDYFYEDTWVFNPNNLDWTWVNGPRGNDRTISGDNCQLDSTNFPGAHYENRANWKLCDDLIISYNGFDDWKTIIPVNNMWGYKISTNEWTKINQWDTTGKYGTQGVASPLNYPPTRLGGVGFTGKDASLWLFGGQSGAGQFYNDLWKYIVDTTCVSCSQIYPLSVPVISQNGSDTLISTPEPNYQWLLNGVPINNSNDSLLIAQQGGTYQVEVINKFGDTVVSNSITLTITSVENVEPENVLLYPNPNSVGSWQLAVGNELIGSRLEIYDDEGHLVFHSAISNQKSEIAIQGLSSGVYFLRISSVNMIITKKLVKL